IKTCHTFTRKFFRRRKLDNRVMILSKKEQDEFFGNYFFLLFYSAVYEGILPQNSRLTDFGRLPPKMMSKSRDALFTDRNIMIYCLEDNKKVLTKENVLFAE